MSTCKVCGREIPDNSAFCPICGASQYEANPYATPAQPAPAPAQPEAPKECPPTHLAKAIIFTLICCWPFGIPAIVNAAGVQNAFLSGKYDLAEQKSKNANKWCNVTLIVGIVFWLLYIALVVILVLTGAIE